MDSVKSMNRYKIMQKMVRETSDACARGFGINGFGETEYRAYYARDIFEFLVRPSERECVIVLPAQEIWAVNKNVLIDSDPLVTMKVLRTLPDFAILEEDEISWFSNLPAEMRGDKDIVLQAVSKSCIFLKFTTWELRSDTEVVGKAMELSNDYIHFGLGEARRVLEDRSLRAALHAWSLLEQLPGQEVPQPERLSMENLGKNGVTLDALGPISVFLLVLKLLRPPYRNTSEFEFSHWKDALEQWELSGADFLRLRGGDMTSRFIHRLPAWSPSGQYLHTYEVFENVLETADHLAACASELSRDFSISDCRRVEVDDERVWEMDLGGDFFLYFDRPEEDGVDYVARSDFRAWLKYNPEYMGGTNRTLGGYQFCTKTALNFKIRFLKNALRTAYSFSG